MLLSELGMRYLKKFTDDRPKQNIQEYLGSITRLQNSYSILSRSNMRSADKVQAEMVVASKT
jgi:hypothetical protein